MTSGLLLYVSYIILGLVSGTAGGLVGIGGGAIVVPILKLVFHKDMHVAIAASLVQMVFVASASAYGHYRNGYILKSVVTRLVPLAAACAIIGVLIGSKVPSAPLQQVFAVFLVYTAIDTGYRLAKSMLSKAPDEVPFKEFTPPNAWGIPAVAVPMGLSCGILGIGGGSIAVPMLHMFLRLPLKNAIANSAAAIFFSSIIASVVKVAWIDGMAITAADGTQSILRWYDPVIVGLLLAPGSFAGGRFGAWLVKRSPTKIIRIIFIVVLLYSANEMWKKAQKSPRPDETPAISVGATDKATASLTGPDARVVPVPDFDWAGGRESGP